MGKSNVKKIIIAIVIIIVAAAMIIICANAGANIISSNKSLEIAGSFDKVQYDEQLVPSVDENGYAQFITDRPIKIMQLTDIHIGGGWISAEKDRKALNCVASMVSAEKPDLVIVTGDVVFPTPTAAGTLNNKTGAKIFAEMMETLGVYWTVAFGNHDTEAYSYYSRDDIGEFYADNDLKYCIFQSGPENIDGCGNQIINVKNSQGIITQSLFIFDSHSYTDKYGTNGEYDNIHQNQIDWYSNSVAELNEENQKAIQNADKNTLPYSTENFETIKSLAFFHIPLKEYDDAWNAYTENSNTNSENAKYYYGIKDENVYCGAGSDNLFETMQSLGSTQGIFCGHDHVNNYSVEYKGIRLTYGMSVDYLAYKDIDKQGDYRGCTLITVNPDGSFDCQSQNYYQDKYQPKFEKEQVTFVH